MNILQAQNAIKWIEKNIDEDGGYKGHTNFEVSVLMSMWLNYLRSAETSVDGLDFGDFCTLVAAVVLDICTRE